MKISELVSTLNRIRTEYGDIDVWTSGAQYSGDPEPATNAVMAQSKYLDGRIDTVVLIGLLEKTIKDGYVI